jgi:CHAD domain-containing protein
MAAYVTALSRQIADLWDEVFEILPKVLDGHDPEAVHDARVASRRLRVAMDAAAPLYPQRWYRKLHREAKSITRMLGRVRDYDVLIDKLAAETAGPDGADSHGRTHLRKRFKQERRSERATMLKRLRACRSRKLRRSIRKRFPRPADEATLQEDAALRAGTRALIANRVAAVLGFDARLAATDSAVVFHEARIAVKRLRYALEQFGREGDGEQVLDDLKRLQEMLGDLHDLDVRIDRLDTEIDAVSRRGRKHAALVLSIEEVRARDRLARVELHRNIVAQWQSLMAQGFRDRLLQIATVP